MRAVAQPVAAPTHAVWPRRLAIAGVSLLLLLVVAIFGPSIYVADQLTQADPKPLNAALAPGIGAHRTDVSFPSRDAGLQLKGWLFRPDTPNGRIVITVHGWKQNRIDASYATDQVAHDLLQHGYAVLMFDLRACGESAGERFTLANREYLDLLGAYDFMKQDGAGTPFDPRQMAVIGDSMGGASTLLASPEMPDVGALVIDSAFAELRPVLEYKLPQEMPLPAFYTQPVLWVGPLFQMDADLRPVDRVKAQPQRAFLFFHGAADDFISPAQGQELRAASANPQSDLVLVPGAKHVKTYSANPTAYMDRVYRFFDQQMAH
jgi:alpha-beta hydrolase superfamily lysophospholipase